MNNYIKCDIKKAEKELKKVCKEYNLPTTAIELILNLLCAYNQTIDEILAGAANRVFFLSQLSGQIFNTFKEFKLTPPKKITDVSEEDDSKLSQIVKKQKN